MERPELCSLKLRGMCEVRSMVETEVPKMDEYDRLLIRPNRPRKHPPP